MSFWDATSAIGTIAAAAIALWIALRDERRRRKTQTEIANLTAAAITLRVALVHERLINAIQWFTFASKSEGSPETYKFQTELLETLQGWSAEELLPLVPLPNRCAFNLASGFDAFEVARRKMRAQIGSYTLVPGENRKMIAAEILVLLNHAAEYIGDGLKECNAAWHRQ